VRDGLGADADLDALAPIAPDELAAAVASPALRKQLVAALLVVALSDEEVRPAEVEMVEQFVRALDVASPYVKNLRRVAEGHLLRMRFDLARRVWLIPKLREAVRERGVGWLARAIAAMLRLKEDRATADRYRAL